MGSYRLVKMLNPISITVNGTFTPKGAYNGATSYSVGDQVDYNGTSYILYSAASAGTLPTDNTKWGVLASKGDTGSAGSPGTPGTNGTNGANGLPGVDGYTPIKGVDYFDGADGATGSPGTPGTNGANGTNGQGVPAGGTTGQQLAKINGTDYNTQWVNPVDISGKADTSALTAHTSNTSNPHSVTKAQVGLGSVPDTDFTSAVAANTAKISFDSTSSTRLANTSGTNTGDNATNTQYSGLATSKQDTLVSGTNIKTINSTSILGSGDIVVAAGSDPLKEDVANKSTTTTLGTSDTLYPSQKAVKTYVDTTAGAYVPLAGGTMTGDLDINSNKVKLNSTASLDGSTAGKMVLNGQLQVNTSNQTSLEMMSSAQYAYNYFRNTKSYSTNNYNNLLLTLKASNGSDQIAMGYLTRFNNTTLATLNSSFRWLGFANGTYATRLEVDGNKLYISTETIANDNLYPGTNISYNLGTSSAYWLNTYTQKLYLNSTAYLDGSTAGRIAVTGVLYSNTDVEITDSTKGVILKSPNGTRWRVTIDNTGALNSTAI